MKYSITTILFLSSCLFAEGQDARERTLLQTSNKGHVYYVDLNDSTATAFRIGRYFDPADEGYSIMMTDTLYKQPTGIYLGKAIKITKEGNEFNLIELKKGKKFRIDTVKNSAAAFNTLNHAFYLDNYSKMSAELNKSYPLSHHSFRNGFYTWATLNNKEIDYLQFKQFATTRIKEVKDSISKLQDSYIVLTDHIVQNIKTIEYSTLKDSLTKLPADYRSVSRYFGTVVNEVAKQKPEYFFKLAEDDVDNRNLIFNSVDDNKEVIQGLERVEGHAEIKKQFFKDRRFGKTILYRVLGTYVVFAGLLTWLIISQP